MDLLFRKPRPARTPRPVRGRFALQRRDLLWYAGEDSGGGPGWDPSRRNARIYSDLDEALAQRDVLRRAGHHVEAISL